MYVYICTSLCRNLHPSIFHFSVPFFLSPYYAPPSIPFIPFSLFPFSSHSISIFSVCLSPSLSLSLFVFLYLSLSISIYISPSLSLSVSPPTLCLFPSPSLHSRIHNRDMALIVHGFPNDIAALRVRCTSNHSHHTLKLKTSTCVV